MQSQKKPFYKHMWFIGLTVFLVLGFIGSWTHENRDNLAVTTSNQTVQSEVYGDFEEVAIANETVAPREDRNSSSNVQSVIVLIENVLGVFYDDFEIYYEQDLNSIVINLAQDGIAMGATLAANGNADMLKSWADVIHGMKELSTAAKGIAESELGTNINVTVNVLNDLKRDNVLLVVWNDTVFFDVVNP